MKRLLIFLYLLVAGCTGITQIELTGKDHYSGWSHQVRELAIHSWGYAQLSQNVYNKNFRFDVEVDFKKIEYFQHESLDFYASLFKDERSGDYILVFRGTDSFKDFRTGNNPFVQKQNELALKIFDGIRKKYQSNNIIVAGHSLGGGIAIHVSLNREGATAYSFNGSPVFKREQGAMDNKRYSIVEYGEVLKGVRAAAKEATQLYTSIGCVKGAPIKQHSMKALAICLTQIAAIEDVYADASLLRNNIPHKYNSPSEVRIYQEAMATVAKLQVELENAQTQTTLEELQVELAKASSRVAQLRGFLAQSLDAQRHTQQQQQAQEQIDWY